MTISDDDLDQSQSLIPDARRLHVATRAAALGIWDWDLRTNRFTYSDRAREICGLPPDEPVTIEAVRAVTHPEDLPRTSAMARQALDPDLRADTPYRYRIIRASDKAVRWVLAYGEAIFEEVEGTVRATRYVGTLQDITEQKLAEDALVESEARLRLALEAAEMAVWEVDLASGRVTHSPKLNRLCGFPPDAQPTLDEFRSRYAPGERERIQRDAAAVIERGERMLQTELRHIWPDGTEKWLLMRAQFAPGETGPGTRVIGVLIDVTERKLAEAQFREMANNAPVMVWVTDENDECTFMSRSWYEFTGQRDGEALGRGWLDCVHPEDRDRTDKASGDSARQGTTYRVEYRMRHADGSWRWVLDAAAPRRDARGRPIGHIGSVIDITERKLDEKRRALLIRELNHRIKNSLAIVQTLARQTFQDIPGAEERLSAFAGRLRALADANEIAEGKDATAVSVAAIVRKITGPYLQNGRDPFEIVGEELTVAPQTAVALGMALHELSTNATKYGALSAPAGRVVIDWSRSTPDRFACIWRETGGPRVEPPARSGFGTRLIERGILMGVGGTASLSFAPAGVECRIEVPRG